MKVLELFAGSRSIGKIAETKIATTNPPLEEAEQALRNNYERSKLPEQLCTEIIDCTAFKIEIAI